MEHLEDGRTRVEYDNGDAHRYHPRSLYKLASTTGPDTLAPKGKQPALPRSGGQVGEGLSDAKLAESAGGSSGAQLALEKKRAGAAEESLASAQKQLAKELAQKEMAQKELAMVKAELAKLRGCATEHAASEQGGAASESAPSLPTTETGAPAAA